MFSFHIYIHPFLYKTKNNYILTVVDAGIHFAIISKNVVRSARSSEICTSLVFASQVQERYRMNHESKNDQN